MRTRTTDALAPFIAAVVDDEPESSPTPKTPTNGTRSRPNSSPVDAAPDTSKARLEVETERNTADAYANSSSACAPELGSSQDIRPQIEPAFVDELCNRRSNSHNLVDWTFGSLLGVESSEKILSQLLDMGIVSVFCLKRKNPIESSGWEAACAAAASLATWAATRSTSKIDDTYRWEWNMPMQASAHDAALFLNVATIAAYAASLRVEGPTSGDGPDGAPPFPTLRYVTMPNPNAAVPLSGRHQDCRPDILAFDTDVFCRAPKTDAHASPHESSPDARLLWSVEDSCPFRFIETQCPAVLTFTPAQRRARPTAIRAFDSWFLEQKARTHLDLARFCWPEVQLTVTARFSALKHALEQEPVYMREHRSTQPWMRAVWGLAVTATDVSMLRADALGVEYCSFAKGSSRGVLDTVRLVLGLARSTEAQRGKYENFELHPTTTTSARHVQVVDSDEHAAKRRRTDGISEHKIVYHHRAVHFIHLRRDKIHYCPEPESARTDTTYFVHYVMPNTGSLTGRCTRVFCVSREIPPDQAAVDAKTRRFEGVYALKLYSADRQSVCFREGLIGEIRKAHVQNILLPDWEWRSGDTLTKRGFNKAVFDQYEKSKRDFHLPGVETNREEIFEQSDMKRMLSQCESLEEFVGAFVNYAEGIASLAEISIAHRDLSIGNVLLNKETIIQQDFWDEAKVEFGNIDATCHVSFTQRRMSAEIGGLIHDLDMAGRLARIEKAPHAPFDASADEIDETDDLLSTSLPSPTSTDTMKESRTGTPPFMAVDLLGRGPPHRVEHDMHSLIFVMILFFWSYPQFLDTQYPRPLPSRTRAWPSEVLNWAYPPFERNSIYLGCYKKMFFEEYDTLRQFIANSLRHDKWMEDRRYLRLFWKLYNFLWRAFPHVPVDTRIQRFSFAPALVIEVLRSYQTSLIGQPSR